MKNYQGHNWAVFWVLKYPKNNILKENNDNDDDDDGDDDDDEAVAWSVTSNCPTLS